MNNEIEKEIKTLQDDIERLMQVEDQIAPLLSERRELTVRINDKRKSVKALLSASSTRKKKLKLKENA